MPRPRKSSGERRRARQEAVRRYNASERAIAARTRWQAKKRSERQSQEIRDSSGKLIAYRLPDGTIQAL